MAKERDNHYRDFSNRKPCNNVTCAPGEVLVPAVLNAEIRATIKENLDTKNVETWHFPYASEKVPVIFVPVQESRKEAALKIFNHEAECFLKHQIIKPLDALSLDKLQGDAESDDEKGYDPAFTTKAMDDLMARLTLDDLIRDLNELNPLYGQIFLMLYEGFSKKEILEKANTGKGKSQGYEFIEEARAAAQKLYTKHYR